MDEVEFLDAIGRRCRRRHGDLHRPDEPAGRSHARRTRRNRVTCARCAEPESSGSACCFSCCRSRRRVRGRRASFPSQNARAHVGMLAGTIGSRPIGTPANASARAYIIDQLRLFGFEVRVQEADARRAPIGLTARVCQHHRGRPGRRSGGDRHRLALRLGACGTRRGR